MPEVENKPKNLVKNRSPQGHFEGQDTIPLSSRLRQQPAEASTVMPDHLTIAFFNPLLYSKEGLKAFS